MDKYSFQFFDSKIRAEAKDIRDLELKIRECQLKLEEKKEDFKRLKFQRIAWEYKMMRSIVGPEYHSKQPTP